MAGGAAVWCRYDVRAGCCCPLLYSYVGRGGVRSPTGAGIIGPARGGGWAWPVQRRRAAGAISYRRGIIEPPRESRPRKTPHGKRATKKEVDAAAGRVYLFFRVMLPGRSFFRGVVRGGRLESIAGHSFPRGRQNVSLHTFARLSGGGFYFFRVRFRRFQIYLCAFCQIAIIRYFFLFIYGHFVHLFSFRNHYNIFSGIVPCAILTAWYNVFCAKGRLHGTMLDSFVFAWYNAITAKETPQNRKEVTLWTLKK